MARTRNAAETKDRLLRAASADFAAHGLAGARVDRIADAAETNKRMIYVYFGSKEALYDAVIDRALDHIIANAPFTPDDLPGYAASLFDMFVASPEILQLNSWRLLLAREPSPDLIAEVEHQRDAIAAAQTAGIVSNSLRPEDLQLFVFTLVTAWLSGSPGLTTAVDKDTAGHRAATITAVTALTEPATTSRP